MAKNQGLGKGLSSLIPLKKKRGNEIPDVLVHEKILKIKTRDLKENPLQPRGEIDHQGLEDLISSVKEHGILQPLIVSKSSGGYVLIAGERRLKAAKIIGFKNVPVIVRDTSRQEKLELALVENLQRSNLNPIEEARAYQKLVDEFNMSQEQVAKRMGKSRETVSNTLRLLGLPEDIRKAIADNKITEGHAKAILSLPDYKSRLKLFKAILKSSLSVRKAENIGQQFKKKLRWPNRIEPGVLEKEDLLREILGTKVKIDKKTKGGKIIIDFYSDSEMNQIIKKITE